jgi:hypothetical protein
MKEVTAYTVAKTGDSWCKSTLSYKLNVWVDMSCLIFGWYDLGNHGYVCEYLVS